MEYVTVEREAADEFIEKKSRFIGSCRPVQTEEEALDFIAKLKSQYWDASHNVYAYILREGNIARFSDDGEPQGTAGIPVIDTLKKAGVVDAVVVATRYFGGILLGGGGLIRAYSHTASIALAAAHKITMRECLLLSLSCDYSLYGKVGRAGAGKRRRGGRHGVFRAGEPALPPGPRAAARPGKAPGGRHQRPLRPGGGGQALFPLC